MARDRDNELRARLPEEDKADPPRAAPGSHCLPWDRFSIPTKAVCPPGAGGWDGELVCAKVVGGDSRRGGITNATAKNRNAGRSCVAGRQPSGSRNVALALKDAGNMPRRNGSDGDGRPLGRTCRRKAKPPRPLPPRLRVVTQQKNIPKFFAIGQDVTNRCENLRVRRPRTVTTTAVRR
jgi:hypothetical protein